MIDKMPSKQIEGLSLEELEAQTGEHLPDREEMSLVNANVAAPVNTAIALNVFSDDSVAIANANQNNFIEQNNFEQNKYGFEQYGDMKGDEMAPVNANVAAPTNTAVAANVASDNSLAYANAEQNNFVEQGNFEQNNFMKNYR